MTQTVLLGDIADIIDSLHQTPKYSPAGYPMVRVTDIKPGYLDTSSCFLVSQEVYEQFSKKHKPQEGDIVFSRVGSEGIPAYVNKDEDFCLGQNTVFIVPKINSKFLYYWLTSPDGKRQVDGKTTGSTQKTISLKSIKELRISLPSEDEQKKIADILGTIDEKIELNRRMNETLEQMGQALFRHYFIDNPESEKWETVRLKEIVDSIKQPLKPGSHLLGRIYLPIDRLQMKSLSILNPLDYIEAKSSLIGFEKNDILVGAMRVYFHRVNIAPAQGVTRTTTFVLRPKEGLARAFTTLLVNQDSTIEYANTHSKGSTMPYAIWENGLGNMMIKLPPVEMLQRFQDQAWPMLEVIRDSHEQIQTLITLRDTLLPRLISGKISL